MIADINTVLFVSLLVMTVGCIKYVHTSQSKFVAGWADWREEVVQRLTKIETILTERKDKK